MSEPHTFIFESYETNGTTLLFHYAFDSGERFTETLEVAQSVQALEPTLLDQLMLALHIALGMSYWKAYVPETMEVRSGTLSKDQAAFWDRVYTAGLGEFYYVNQIDFRGLVNFPYADDVSVEPTALETAGALVPLGGGKDSLLTAAVLGSASATKEMPINTFSLNSYPVIEKQAQVLGTEHLVVRRTLDKQLLVLNDKPGVYNGHVPISVIYGLTAVLQAALSGRQYVVLSNERSANVGNVEYLGEEINHQWSKSLEFERAFQDYIHSFVTPDITYFSLLRPLTDLRIVDLLMQVAPQHGDMLTSCNRNFRIAGDAADRWCGECPKDAFTFCLFAAVAGKERTLEIFEGKNLFDSAALLDTYKELLGTKDIKPFDCVGTVEEVQVAFAMAHERGDFDDTVAMQYFVEEVLPELRANGQIGELRTAVFSYDTQHALPAEFEDVIQ